jgi:hypothetical protein
MRFDALHHFVEGTWAPLPEWARFFFMLGPAIAHSERSDSRLVIGLSLPARAYAASFLATAIVAEPLTASLQKRDMTEHFNQLCRLKVGTSLEYRESNKKYKAVFEGLVLLQESGQLCRYICYW